MASIINNILGGAGNKSSNRPTDETLIYSLMAATAAASTAYLTATLDASTPEVRRMLHDYTNQMVTHHEELTKLAVKKGWYLPYEAPLKQLQISYNNTQDVISTNPQ